LFRSPSLNSFGSCLKLFSVVDTSVSVTGYFGGDKREAHGWLFGIVFLSSDELVPKRVHYS
jgi:hypothetical protein